MNGKKAKALRKLVRSLGHTKAGLPDHHISLTGKIVPASHLTVRGNVTAKYPKTSFQAAYTAAKRKFSGLTVAVINARAELNFAANA